MGNLVSEINTVNEIKLKSQYQEDTMKKMLLGGVILIVAGALIFMSVQNSRAKNKTEFKEIPVERGSLTEKALAVGEIGPDHEIVIKSQVSGIVEKIYCEVGEQVKQGDPIMVVKPEPTPLELAEARRQCELADLNLKYLKTDMERTGELYKNKMVSGKEYDEKAKAVEEAVVLANQAKERLELMENGSAEIGDILIESVIRAPTDGTILERMVNVGDPVVPLTSYQPGTELLKIADMEKLIFIGTVDEIDVGKIETGMRAEINIGAIPDKTLPGELYFISPKSRLKDNVVVFDIKIQIMDTKDITIRAGYSASCDLIVNEKQDVLCIPERLVSFANDTTLVYMKDAVGDSLVTHTVALGFSDGLSVEVLDGLAEGDMIVEK